MNFVNLSGETNEEKSRVRDELEPGRDKWGNDQARDELSESVGEWVREDQKREDQVRDELSNTGEELVGERPSEG